MTAITSPAHAPEIPGAARRILNVVRLNTANPWTVLTLPWIIIGVIFIANWLIWWIIATATGQPDASAAASGLQWSGASSWIFFYMAVVAVQAVNLTFPLALGYGVTRRDFWIGTSLTFVGLSALYAVTLTVLSVIEELTGGWGLGGRMFTTIYFGDVWYVRLFVFFTLMMVFFFVGASIATIYVRWKANGVVTFFIILGFVLVGAIALVSFTDSWGTVGEFFARSGFVGSLAWTYVITGLAAILGYLVLRRATPRS